MSAIGLRRVDCSGSDTPQVITVPRGKTGIGRGPFLNCSDKKVSRNHGELELTVDGSLYITSVHVSPCFLNLGAGREGGKPLEKDKPHKLEVGDQFSLLCDSYTFEVVSLDRDQNGQNPADDVVDDSLETLIMSSNDTHVSTEPALEPTRQEQGDPSASAVESPAEEFSEEEDIIERNSSKKRTLPSWLKAAAGSAPKTDSSPLQGPKGKKAKTQRGGNASTSSETLDRRRNVAKVPGSSISITKTVKYSGDEPNSDPKTPKLQIKNGKKAADLGPDISEEEDDADIQLSEDSRSTAAPQKLDVSPGSSNNGSPVKNKKRTPCEYGSKCYRKNPLHFKECSHPGDDDYASDVGDPSADDSDDDRPECEFGTDCYRKNPQHRKQYKHCKRPQRKAAQAAQKKVKRRHQSDDEADSYDSSFIDDGDDSLDDSNYSPDEEDLKTLKDEAKQFVRNKKFHKVPS